jgi:putative component of toxin-antitoxin plasmid stabilization module
VVSAIAFDITIESSAVEDRLTLMLGTPGGDHVSIRASHRLYPDRADTWDGNWIACRIDVEVGAFRGGVDASLRAEDFVSFRDALHRIQVMRQGEASFETMEEWLVARVVGDGRGHYEAVCELRDAPGAGNRLYFQLGFDEEPTMSALLSALDQIAKAFPVRH